MRARTTSLGATTSCTTTRFPSSSISAAGPSAGENRGEERFVKPNGSGNAPLGVMGDFVASWSKRPPFNNGRDVSCPCF